MSASLQTQIDDGGAEEDVPRQGGAEEDAPR